MTIRGSSVQQATAQSVSKALDLLEVFPEYGPELGLSKIANLLNMNKATAYRLLSTLEQRGFVERLSDNRKYRLGLSAFKLGLYYQAHLQIRHLSLMYLKQMVSQTRESAFLCVREGDEALCIERVEGDLEVNIFVLRVGGKQPLHCGGAPRALLVGMDDRQLEAYALRTGLPRMTPHTINKTEQLIEDVRRTREQGYVVSMNDATIGIAAIGAPIFDHTGKTVAAISLSGLANRYEAGRIPALAEIVMASAGSLSRQLGYQVNKVSQS